MAKAAIKKEEEGDWLKYYCIVFGLLTVVVAVMYFKISSDLDDYERVNRTARDDLDVERDLARGQEETPRTIPGLALSVKKLVSLYKESIGGEEGRGISSDIMDTAMVEANIGRPTEGSPDEDKNRRGGYVTISRDFTYPDTTLRNLAALIHNIEAHRYRVFEMRWLIDESKEGPPRYYVKRPMIQVGIRKPLSAED